MIVVEVFGDDSAAFRHSWLSCPTMPSGPPVASPAVGARVATFYPAVCRRQADVQPKIRREPAGSNSAAVPFTSACLAN